MTWFKVDDKFWSHPKVMLTSTSATGVWVRAGAWCAMHLTDGRIPVQMLRMIIPERPRDVDRMADDLVAAGLWIRDGDDWAFHQWFDHQPSRDRVEANREASRKRQEAARERRRLYVVGDSDGESLRESRRDSARSNGASARVPTRPDPTRPELLGGGPVPPPPSSSAEEGTPCCEHGAPPRACALCRHAKKKESSQ